ncbi:hypothetical protein BT63DRAFT_461234 [Microthyrium microscopicum]|uniref:Uncharacterized protein n=1 Tax=Microthyrium microscopicum TaxID=703497 RepID=A0A6A6TWH8_9PEZI|nr:hypothetical protein BT63DRAFT_461234 [Microthyrium microscopicum]
MANKALDSRSSCMGAIALVGNAPFFLSTPWQLMYTPNHSRVGAHLSLDAKVVWIFFKDRIAHEHDIRAVPLSLRALPVQGRGTGQVDDGSKRNDVLPPRCAAMQTCHQRLMSHWLTRLKDICKGNVKTHLAYDMHVLASQMKKRETGARACSSEKKKAA